MYYRTVFDIIVMVLLLSQKWSLVQWVPTKTVVIMIFSGFSLVRRGEVLSLRPDQLMK